MNDAARIAELLEVLRAAKVARFEDGAIKVEFDPRAFDPPLPPPRANCSSTIANAIRSLIDPPGFDRSDLIQISAPSPKSRLIRIWGVFPIVSRMVAAFIRQSPGLASSTR